jgi:hypothetical protein
MARVRFSVCATRSHVTRLRRLLCVALLLTATPWTSAHAQMLRGVVHDPQGRPLPDATVRLVRSGVSARTDAQGEYSLRVSVAGADTLLVRLIGWRPVQLVFEFDGVSDLDWSIPLERQPRVLDTVRATADRECPMFNFEAFLCRSRSAVGYKRNAEELAQLRPRYWADLFDGLPGVRRIGNGAGDFTVEPTIGWRCLVELINGRPVGLSGRVYFTPDAVIGMEYYPSYAEVPEVYRRYAWEPLRVMPGSISSHTATCGVVVYWIRGVPMSDSSPRR